MPTRNLELRWPILGIDKRFSLNQQRDFTSPFMTNVRPFDALSQQRRGGSRPDLVKTFTQKLGSGEKVNLLNTMRTTNLSGATVLTDEFTRTDDDVLSANSTTWDSAIIFTGFLAIGGAVATELDIHRDGANGFARADTGTAKVAGLVAGKTSTIDTAQPYAMSMSVPLMANNEFVYIWFGMDNTTPAESRSIGVRLNKHLVDNEWSIAFMEDGNVVSLHPGLTGVTNSVMSVVYDSSNDTVSVTWNGHRRTQNVSSYGAFDGHRIGIGADASGGGATPGNIDIDWFRLDSFTGTSSPKELVVAASGGTLYQEKPSGTMVAVVNGSTLTLATNPVESVQRLGKLYIADFSVPRKERTTASTEATLVAATGVLTDTEATFTTAGDTFVIAGGDVIELTSVTGGDVSIGFYEVVTVTDATNIIIKTLSGAFPGTTPATALAYRIIPGLKVYDVASDTLSLWKATSGIVPYGCRHIAKHLDRLVLSGDPNNESTVFFSGQGDTTTELGPNRWLEVATDVSSAVFTGSATGLEQSIGAPVTGIIGYTRDYFLIFTDEDIWLIRGDLRQGGSMHRLSASVGMLSGQAFNIDSDNNIRFLARNGVYQFAQQAIANNLDPQPFSKERIPKELRGIDPDTHSVVMGFSPDEGGVYLWITPLQVGASTEFFTEPNTGSFSPDTLATDHQVFSSTYLGRTNEMLVGCRDGFIRKYDPDGSGDDDGIVRTQEVDYGPIPLNRGRAAMVDSLEITLDESSSDVSWAFRTGKSPEEAFDAAPRASGTATKGRNYRQPVRHFGQWGFLRLSTTTAARWAVESISLRVQPAAEQRKI